MNIRRGLLSTVSFLVLASATTGANATACGPSITAICFISSDGDYTVPVSTTITASNTATEYNTIDTSLAGTITFTNNGTINNTLPAGFDAASFAVGSSVTVTNFSNTGTISSLSMGLYNGGTITTLNNAAGAFITGGHGGIVSYGTIGTMNNYGSIAQTDSFVYSGTPLYGALANYGSITDIFNYGTIDAQNNSTAIVNGVNLTGFTYVGTIGNIYNLGTISLPAGSTGYGIDNRNGTIGRLDNIQTGLTYNGNLPTLYNVIVSSTGYGTLTTSNVGSSVTTIGISSYTTAGRTTDMLGVISGVSAANLANANGTVTYNYGGVTYSFVLSDTNSDQTWDLIFSSAVLPGPDADNTRAALAANAQSVRSVLNQRQSSLAFVTSYDCQTFDTNGFCASFQARYSNFGDAFNNGAGVLTASYRLLQNIRIGAFIDYAGNGSDPNGIRLSNTQPTFGAYAGYDQNGNRTGLQGKVLAAVQNGHATINRNGDPALNTESGSGKASLNSHVVAAELGWGFALTPAMLATPYVGLRYTESRRGAYAENMIAGSVDYPISYTPFYQRLTTAEAGVRLSGMLTEQMGYQLGAGIEYDLKQQTNAYSGTSTISGLESFSLATSGTYNRTRGVGSVGLFYQVDKNQRITANVGVRNQAYSNQAAVAAMVGYQIGF